MKIYHFFPTPIFYITNLPFPFKIKAVGLSESLISRGVLHANNMFGFKRITVRFETR